MEELRTPVLTVKEWSKEEFCRADGLKHLSLFDHLKKTFNDAESGSSWYMAAHFINQKYLNHLLEVSGIICSLQRILKIEQFLLETAWIIKERKRIFAIVIHWKFWNL